MLRPYKFYVSQYTQGSSLINYYLRSNPDREIDYSDLEKFPLVSSLWRGMPLEYLIQETEGDVFSGGLWSPKGVVSTSTKKDIAVEFSDKFKDGVLIYLYDVSAHSIFSKSCYPWEEEAIFIRGIYHIIYLAEKEVFFVSNNKVSLEEALNLLPE